MTATHGKLRAELVAMLEDDETAVGAVYAGADLHRAAFEATQPITTTPWPYAIFEWSPEEDRPPDYAVLSTAYTVMNGVVGLIDDLDLDEVDRRRLEIGLPPVAVDLEARASGQPIQPGSWEPWPAHGQSPSTSNS